jgi:hypothetical protein
MACYSSWWALWYVLVFHPLYRTISRHIPLLNFVLNYLYETPANLQYKGMSGMLVGGFAGVIRSSTPTLFALASGIQWFTLGTTFWGL